MVVFFSVAGTLGGVAAVESGLEAAERIVAPLLAIMGLFGTVVLAANCIWAYNIFRTCAGWEKTYESL